jgi:hypothetical protein
VEVDNGVEERLGDSGGGVRVVEGDEVCILGEAVDHRQDDRFATHTRESLHKIKCYVAPDAAGHDERLKQSHRMQVLGLVPLANRAALDVVADELVVAGREGGAQTLQCFLDPFMTHATALSGRNKHPRWTTVSSMSAHSGPADPAASSAFLAMMSGNDYATRRN